MRSGNLIFSFFAALLLSGCASFKLKPFDAQDFRSASREQRVRAYERYEVQRALPSGLRVQDQTIWGYGWPYRMADYFRESGDEASAEKMEGGFSWMMWGAAGGLAALFLGEYLAAQEYRSGSGDWSATRNLGFAGAGLGLCVEIGGAFVAFDSAPNSFNRYLSGQLALTATSQVEAAPAK